MSCGPHTQSAESSCRRKFPCHLLTSWVVLVLLALSSHASPTPFGDSSHNDQPFTQYDNEWKNCHGYNTTVCQQVIALQHEIIQKIYTEMNLNEDQTNHTSRLAQLSRDPEAAPLTAPEDEEQFETLFFTLEQLESMMDDSSDTRRYKRKLDPFGGSTHMWQLPIRYLYDEDHTSTDRDQIEAGIDEWERETCIRFHEMDEDSNRIDPFILFTKHRSCGSYIGNVDVIPQQVDLAQKCLLVLGTIVHEIGHALGFWHEHQRSDRDDFVTVNDGNALPSFTFLSEIWRTGRTQNIFPYDYGSVLHYDSVRLTANGRPTISTNNPLYLRTIGQRNGLSFLDVKLANFAYCPSECNNVLRESCQRGGYQDPNDCYKCKCPDGFAGTYCDEVADFEGEPCGDDEYLMPGDEYDLYSPGYFPPNRMYDNFQSCSWKFRTHRGYQLHLAFRDNYGVYLKGSTCAHWVEVRYFEDLGLTGPRFCGWDRPDDLIVSDGREMLVLFRSNYDADEWHRRGFRATVTSEPYGTGDDNPMPTTEPPPTTTPTTTPRPTRRPTRPTTRRPTTTPRPTRRPTRPTTTTTRRPTRRPTTTPAPTPPPTDPPTQQPTAGCGAVDLAFILDSSGSIGARNWQRLLMFINSIVDELPIGTRNIQVGIVSFGSDAEVNFDFDEHLTSRRLERAIEAIDWKDAMTNTSGGIWVTQNSLYGSRGGQRTGVPNVAYLITDGRPNRDRSRTLPEAEYAKSSGTELFIIGVGSSRNLDLIELEGMVSSPAHNHLHQTRSFSSLYQLKDTVLRAVCDRAVSVTDPVTPRPPPDVPQRPHNGGSACSTPGPLDIAFLLDSSGSVGVSNWRRGLNFVKSVVERLNVEDREHRVTVGYFGTRAHVGFTLDMYYDNQEMFDALDDLRWRNEGTNTTGALRVLRREMFVESYGDREEVPNVGILLTDGPCNRDSRNLYREARSVARADIKMLTVAIGSLVDQEQLRDIASDPDYDYMLSVDDYYRLPDIIDDVISALCYETGTLRPDPNDEDPYNNPNQPNRLPTTPLPEECGPADVAFVLDASGSIGEDNWPKVLDFSKSVTRNLMSATTRDVNSMNQVAVVTYGNRATVQFRLGEFNQVGAASGDDTELFRAFDNIGYKNQWTNTSGGIYAANTLVFGDTRFQDRPGAGNVIALLTDGVSNRDRHLTVPEANHARDNGNQFVVIGVGGQLDLDELNGIVGAGNDRYLNHVPSFDDLRQVIDDVYKQICEVANTPLTVERPTPAPEPTTPPDMAYNDGCSDLDIAFALDASQSVSSSEWRRTLRFVQSVVSELDIGEYDNHVGVVTFGRDAEVEFYLNDYLLKTSLMASIGNIRWSGYGTNTAGALYLMRSVMFNERRGDRSTSSDIAIFIVDGQSDVDAHLTRDEARAVKRLGIEVFVIGVGTRVDDHELQDIASDPHLDHIIYVDEYDDLSSVKTNLYDKICSTGGQRHQSQSIQPPTTPREATRRVETHIPNQNEWGPWSSCSEHCGGCGRRWRYRQCDRESGNENCGTPEVEHCNERVCTVNDMCSYTDRWGEEIERSCTACCDNYQRHRSRSICVT